MIATNLALLDDRVLDFCRANDVFISTSLDGPADLHNKNRPRPGRNSWELATAGIRRVREELGVDRVSALMTTTRSSLGRVREIIDCYVEQGLTSMFLRPLSPYGFAIKTKSFAAYGVDRWLPFYEEGLDYIIELNAQGSTDGRAVRGDHPQEDADQRRSRLRRPDLAGGNRDRRDRLQLRR